ncbi:uncharacterized protein [Choristoneura fumiferana]|uniref:uncharacterized protein n=1 Tax=Choristoneura fumiferana TaxID=7141 RepID=UPI003D15D21E
MKPHGRPTALSEEEELYIVENLNVCGDWGYPLDTTDLRHIIKMYLDSLNIKHKLFKNNFPGKDYANAFLKRHADKISQRICQNIKRSRAAISSDKIKTYFGELEKSLENVPIANIINYDETNLTDDPGRKKVIVRRGCKYPERIVNHSKGSTSVMMAATADGNFLPPYVVYKSLHLYDSWTMRGPENVRYNRSSSGWFDCNIFEDWVKTIVIPFLEGKDGKKNLIGDNLSSHLSIDIIKLCQEKNIHFIFLPANSTHLTQPLDVAVFRPMKMIWRCLLDKWKKSEGGRMQACVPKGCFPSLLKLLMDELKANAEKNIKAGFRKCGIVPLDCNQVLARLPLQEGNEEAKKAAVDNSFVTLLKDMRYGSINIREPIKKRKIEVVSGRSVSFKEIEEQEPVNPKKKKTLKQTNETTSSLKGKGMGKKTKPKNNIMHKEDDVKNNYSETRNCSQSEAVNACDINDVPLGLNEFYVVTPEHSDLNLSNEDQQPVNQKRKRTLKQTNKSTSKLTPLKEKGIGKKTKPKTNKVQKEDDFKNDYSEAKICGQREAVNGFNIMDVPMGLNKVDVIVNPEPFEFCIEDMPFVFADNLDCQEVIVRTDDQDQKCEKENKQVYKKENENRQSNNIQKSEIKIISYVKLKLPLPLEKKDSNTNIHKRSISTRPKRGRILNCYKDAEEILKIIEEK